MIALSREPDRTPEEVAAGLHYLLHEEDFDRIHKAFEVLDLLSQLTDGGGSAVTLDHVAAVASYAADDLSRATTNMVRCTPKR